MRLALGVLADYAFSAEGKKLSIIGIVDTVYNRMGVLPIPLPRLYLVLTLEASAVEGTEHHLSVKFADADGGNVLKEPMVLPVRFGVGGPGRPVRANLLLEMQLAVPKEGDYEFQIWVDDRHVGDVPLYVAPPPG